VDQAQRRWAEGEGVFVAALDNFLDEHQKVVRWRPFGAAVEPLKPHSVFLGRGGYELEVALASAAHRPKVADVRALWRQRQGNRPNPLLLVIAYVDRDRRRAAICGPVGSAPPVETDLDLAVVEQLAAVALAEPSPHAAVRLLMSSLDGLRAELIPGVRNAGLLATHELRVGVPQRPDWPRQTAAGRRLLQLRGRRLLEALGFAIDPLDSTASVLTAGVQQRAVALLLEESETFENLGHRFPQASPVSHGLAQAARRGLPWVVLTRGPQVRLYSAWPDTGVGRKGPAETFVELNLSLLAPDAAGYLPLLFGAGALEDNGTVTDILTRSADFAAELGSRLRERLYDAVPGLAMAIAQHQGIAAEPSAEDLRRAYEQTLTLLFRLLFVAYAEDTDVLPYQSNADYKQHALKTRARALGRQRTPSFSADRYDVWDELSTIFAAIDGGRPDWGVSSYNGGLFSADPAVHAASAALAGMRLSDAEIGPALYALLVDVGPDEVVGPVDFRSLSVPEFGTLYEGLLESRLSVAPTALALDARGQYVPTSQPDRAVVAPGDVYFHNRSGARKASGTYFTKPFAVEHLLDTALEPALDDHLARIGALLDEGRAAAAAEAFFDFRCADIAMGSGHFLVAAVDRIAARLSAFLALRPIPAVTAELDRLSQQALRALDVLAPGIEMEHTRLLRRLVARRCIYGLDLNPMAVELTRLSLWIQTLVPGLPLSWFDHNLRAGNSLTGIGSLDEVVDVLDPGDASLFRDSTVAILKPAAEPLRWLGRLTDATREEIQQARKAQDEADTAVEPARRRCDLAVAVRLGEVAAPLGLDEASLAEHPSVEVAGRRTAELNAVHLPVVWPEVFLRDPPGFDCLIGNPPWQEVTVEEPAFWALRFPGLRALNEGQKLKRIGQLRAERPDLVADFERETNEAAALRAVLLHGSYPGMGSGDPDLYKAFCWRFWHLARDGGAVGIVLPRSALAASGSAPWRDAVLDGGAFADVTMLLNNRGWAFDDLHQQFTLGLVSLRKGTRYAGTVHLAGPFASWPAYAAGRRSKATLDATELRTWSTGAAFPLLPRADSLPVFRKLRAAPRFDASRREWRFRPVREFDATLDKKHFHFGEAAAPSAWPVYKGSSFNIWQPDTGEYYASAEPDHVLRVLQEKRRRQHRNRRSAFSELPGDVVAHPSSLPCLHPRIAFRDVARATDSRTVIVALVPPHVVLANKAPYLLRVTGGERDEALLLGVLSSIPLDWYARRCVELSLSVYLVNALPIPDASNSNPIRRRVEVIAGRLAAVDSRYADWAAAVGVPVGSVTDAEKPELLAELDACVAVLYGLDASDVRHIFETFHVGWDFHDRLARVLTHLNRLSALPASA
jgi:hypothetical protein